MVETSRGPALQVVRYVKTLGVNDGYKTDEKP